MAEALTHPRAWRVGVVVPARDEVDRIGVCLASVAAALDVTGCVGVVVVVADRCTDATAVEARRVLGSRGRVVECAHGSVGRARGRGAAAALAELPGPPSATWLAATDADTVVPPGWLASQLAWADRGAAAVAGTVRLDEGDGPDPEVRERWRLRYRAGRADDAHVHVHGANLGVRADAYLSVGGWPDLPTAEDHGLWARLRSAGWPTASPVDTWVTTSGRRDGRAPGGVAADLRALEDAG